MEDSRGKLGQISSRPPDDDLINVAKVIAEHVEKEVTGDVDPVIWNSGAPK
jgi:hypothetical protein